MIRVLDLCFAATGLAILFPLILFVVIIGWFDTRSPLFRQRRVGREKSRLSLSNFGL